MLVAENRAFEIADAEEVVGAAAVIIDHAEIGLHPVHPVSRLCVGEAALLFLVPTDIPHPDLPAVIDHGKVESDHELFPWLVRANDDLGGFGRVDHERRTLRLAHELVIEEPVARRARRGRARQRTGECKPAQGDEQWFHRGDRKFDGSLFNFRTGRRRAWCDGNEIRSPRPGPARRTSQRHLPK